MSTINGPRDDAEKSAAHPVTTEREAWALWEAEATSLVDEQPSAMEDLSEDDEPFQPADFG